MPMDKCSAIHSLRFFQAEGGSKGEAPCKICFQSWVSHCSTRCLLNQQDTPSCFSIVPWLHLNLGEDSWAQALQRCKSKRVKGRLTCDGLLGTAVCRANCTPSSAAEAHKQRCNCTLGNNVSQKLLFQL